jgi:hypothetical protein
LCSMSLTFNWPMFHSDIKKFMTFCMFCCLTKWMCTTNWLSNGSKWSNLAFPQVFLKKL